MFCWLLLSRMALEKIDIKQLKIPKSRKEFKQKLKELVRIYRKGLITPTEFIEAVTYLDVNTPAIKGEKIETFVDILFDHISLEEQIELILRTIDNLRD